MVTLLERGLSSLASEHHRLSSPIHVTEIRRRVDTYHLLKAYLTVEGETFAQFGGIKGLNRKLIKTLFPILQTAEVCEALTEPSHEKTHFPFEARLAWMIMQDKIRVHQNSLVQLDQEGGWTLMEECDTVRRAISEQEGTRVVLWEGNSPPSWALIRKSGRLNFDATWHAHYQGIPIAIYPHRFHQLHQRGKVAIVLPGTSKDSLPNYRAKALELIRKRVAFFEDGFVFWWENFIERESLHLEVWDSDSEWGTKIIGLKLLGTSIADLLTA